MGIFSPSLGYGESTLYEIASSKEHRLWQAVGAYGAAFSHDGTSLLIAGDDGEQGVVQIFSAETGALQWTFETHQEWEVDAVIYSLDGTRVVASSGPALFVWEGATGQLQTTLTNSSAIRCLACSPTDAMILAGCDDGIRLWDASTGNEHEALPLRASTHSLAFSPDGAYLLAGGEDAVARLWRWPERVLVSTFEGHEGAITSVTFSPDGKTILTGSLDTTARMWPVVTEHHL
jgi:WD40 repeat protein